MQGLLEVTIPLKAYTISGYSVTINEIHHFVLLRRGDIGYYLTLDVNGFILKKFDFLNKCSLKMYSADLKKFGIEV